jgi:heptosyltransferase II
MKETASEIKTAHLGRLAYNLFFVRRVLVEEVASLPDLVTSLPALRALRVTFEGAKLSVLVRDDLASFFRGMRWIDEVIPYAAGQARRSRFGRWRITRKIRRRRFDLAVTFADDFESALWLALARVPLRAGYATNGRGLLLTHNVRPAADALENHQVHYWLEMLRNALGIAPIAHLQDHILEVDGRSVRKMEAWLTASNPKRDSPLLAIAPTAETPAREWQPERYAALIDLLAKRHGAQCVLIGAQSERAKCEQIAARSRSAPIIAAASHVLSELMALLSLCDGFVGNDSGVTSLAAALGLPTVGIFGSTDPARTAPMGATATFAYHQIECNPCGAHICPYGHYNCLRWVTPHEVADSLTRLGAFKLKAA